MAAAILFHRGRTDRRRSAVGSIEGHRATAYRSCSMAGLKQQIQSQCDDVAEPELLKLLGRRGGRLHWRRFKRWHRLSWSRHEELLADAAPGHSAE